VIGAGGDISGSAEGNNLGIRCALESGAELVALLNPDTWVEPEWLRCLVEASQSATRQLGIVGAVQLRYDGDDFKQLDDEQPFPRFSPS
jgi:GT2 family glycosyltransferase